MIRRAAIVAALAVSAAAPGFAQTDGAAQPAVARLSELANGMCVDILSGNTALPADVSGEDAFNARYGLTSGVPNSVMTAFGSNIGLVAQARLASGETPEGTFVVAMGGRAGETCRLIMMSGSQELAIGPALHTGLQAAGFGWRNVPVTRQAPTAVKLSLFKRDAQGKPFLANILTPTTPGPVAMIVTVAAIPPNVTLPEGY
jgi:hypothetical protein